MPVAAIVFDLDGVIVDSETVWDDARRQVVAAAGRSWPTDATRAMMGMSSPEWAAYLRDRLGVTRPVDQIIADVVAHVEQAYRTHLPLLPGAAETVQNLASAWPLGLASSSNRPVIDLVLDASGLRACFEVTVSSEEVARGKPAPDVYLEAARRLHARPEQCVAVEDSTNGIRAALAARLSVIAVPNSHYPPENTTLEDADIVVGALDELTPELVMTLSVP
ncbi:MAG TPA: HAD family phosphatase [Acidimicrobiales bacterium]|nr:HAD family phosphatase [Acidimicrobiales bacterium]